MIVVVSAIVDPWVTTLSFVVALAMRIQGQIAQTWRENQARWDHNGAPWAHQGFSPKENPAHPKGHTGCSYLAVMKLLSAS